MYLEREGNLFSRHVIHRDLLYQRVSNIHMIIKLNLCLQLKKSFKDIKWLNTNHSCVFQHIICLFGCLYFIYSASYLTFSLLHKITLCIIYWLITKQFALQINIAYVILLNYYSIGLLTFIYFFRMKYIVIFIYFMFYRAYKFARVHDFI